MPPTADLTFAAGTTRGRSHRRVTAFVQWIKPSAETRETIVKQTSDIRAAISAKATADSLTVIATPDGGSFAKHTGLRRHIRGGIEVEGQDVDLPFVVKPHTTEGERLTDLLRRFDSYAQASYPTTPRRVTASSVELQFVSSKLNYDLVPMLSSAKTGYQVILKKDGTRRTTSVAKHTEFVRSRTRKSDEQAGRVKFNECVRLMKWWRCVRLSDASTVEEVRTMLIELLCASAFDRIGVAETYTETLHKWFSWIASVARRRAPVSFADYPSVETPLEQPLGNHLWHVIDPVNANNNVVHKDWGNIELDEFASWLETARDTMSRIVSYESAGNDSKVDELLAEMFGNAVLIHGAIS